MQKLQDNSFSVLKTTSLSPAVFSFLQPTDDLNDKTPLGGIINDSKHGWLALGPKFCVIDLKTGLKIAAWIFGASTSSSISVSSVVELPTPLTGNSRQLVISLECDDTTGIIAVFHVNGSQILRCIQTEVVVSELTVCNVPDGPFASFDSVVVAGTNSGEILVFDLNRAALLQALKDTIHGNEDNIRNEQNMANLTFLPLKAVPQISEQRELALESDEHIAVLLNENSLVDSQFLFHNPDGSVRMKAKRDHIRVSTMKYIPQLGSVTVGYNFGAFQIWNLMTLELEFTSQVNVECLPVTHFGFQEPCDDPRAFCYLWVVYSVLDRFQDDQFPLAVMYSLTYQGKRMLSDTQYLYQDFLTSNIRFQLELCSVSDGARAAGGRCVSCHTFSINSTLGDEGEDSTLNICQLVWECWAGAGEGGEAGMLLFDLDQWYKDQMPATYQLQNNTFMCVSPWTGCSGRLLASRLVPHSVTPYCHATRLEEHFYPNSLQYTCICLSTSEVSSLGASGVQRQIVSSLLSLGERALLAPSPLYLACLAAGLTPLYAESRGAAVEEQRRFLLSVALEARLTQFLKKCAHDWATGAHASLGCTLPFMVDWCWKRAIELKQNAKELTAPLFTSAALPDRNSVRCLEHCVRQLGDLASLLDSALTTCCNLLVPDALSEMEEKHRGISTVALYFLAVQWLLSAGLLPERRPPAAAALPYPARLADQYRKRRIKLNRLQEGSGSGEGEAEGGERSCELLYIDQLIQNECGGEKVYEAWRRSGSTSGLYPPPSLHALLRLYLRPELPDEHKHSLVLYLLLDYSCLYDDVRYEPVIRRLMQFPTMFGLSTTAIKATQAFWHLDHRDFDFALDQLQCLPSGALAEWQHSVALAALLAQHKTQQALQYLTTRKPRPGAAPCWRMSTHLYLARGLLSAALDVTRTAAAAAAAAGEETLAVLEYFFKGCRNTGQLAKLLEVSLQPQEEEAFLRFLENSPDSAAGDLLVMYLLQQARYLEAQQYNNRLKKSRPTQKISSSHDSLVDWNDKALARDTIVEVICGTLPHITGKVAHTAMYEFDDQPHVLAPKPMSVFVQAKSPKNQFTYKSSFIQDTIENASETWVNKPQLRKGLKRALNIEEIPFLCTPKLNRTRSIFQQQDACTPPKRPKFDLSPATPKPQPIQVNQQLAEEMATLLEMPDPPPVPANRDQGRATPMSILKIRRSAFDSEAGSGAEGAESAGAGEGAEGGWRDSEDELADCQSTHTHLSDKHLRFEIPSTVSEYGSTATPSLDEEDVIEMERSISATREREADISVASFKSATGRSHVLESPPKIEARRSYKDSVRARRSLSISANSSLCEDANASIESIADIPFNLVNTSYRPVENIETEVVEEKENVEGRITPRGRKPIGNRGKSLTPERAASPAAIATEKLLRSKQGVAELQVETEEATPVLSAPQLRPRNRSRTPERFAPAPAPAPAVSLEAVVESPTNMDVDHAPPSPKRSMRSRSRTPEVVETKEEPAPASPRNLRSRSKTPDREKVLTPQEKPLKTRKSLSRMVLEHNTFKSMSNEETEKPDQSENAGESTPKKSTNQIPGNLLDVTFSPINKSVLQSPEETYSESGLENETTSDLKDNKSLGFTTFNETYFEKSVLHSYESSVGENSTQSIKETIHSTPKIIKMDPLDSSNSKSVLKDVSSLMTSDSDNDSTKRDSSVQQEKQKIVEIEREIHEIEVDISDEEAQQESSEDTDEDDDEEEDSDGEEGDEQDEQDVISIGDTTDDSSNSEQLHIDENADSNTGSESRNTVECPTEEVNIYEGFEAIEEASVKDGKVEKEIQASEDRKAIDVTSHCKTVEDIVPKETSETKASEEKVDENKDNLEKDKQSEMLNEDKDKMVEVQKDEDPLAPSVSLLTDDNSIMSERSDVSLNYSDEKKEEKVVEEKMEQDVGAEIHEAQPQLKIDIIVEKIVPIPIQSESTVATANIPIDIDVVDAVIKPEEEMEAKSVRTRKRVKSTSSNKLVVEETEPVKTPQPTLKRTKSTSSNQSDEPTPNTMRRILTRRASKELAEKSINESVDIEEIVTPKRRARSKSKEEDSKKEEVQVRKGRKSILATNTDLSVIPEMSTDEGGRHDDSVANYASVRRLTRTQKAVLSARPPAPSPARRSSRHSSITEEVEDDSSIGSSEQAEEGSSERELREVSPVSSVVVKPKRRLSRAASETKTATTTSTAKPKPVRRGSVDVGSPERELREVSPVSSEVIKPKRRLYRAASETKTAATTPTTPKPKPVRRGSVDVGSPERDLRDVSPVSSKVVKPKRRLSRAASESKTAATTSTTAKPKPVRRGSVDVSIITASEIEASPRRARRASFARAVEALTPRSRRASTDTDVKQPESVNSSPPSAPPSPATPARRGRRAASTQSDASDVAATPTRRGRKPSSEQAKGGKK